jgi:hypothetical protein
MNAVTVKMSFQQQQQQQQLLRYFSDKVIENLDFLHAWL